MRIQDSVQHTTVQMEASLEYFLAADARLTAGDTAKDIASMSEQLAELSTAKLTFEHVASPAGSSDDDIQTNREFNSLFLRVVDSVAAYDAQQHLANLTLGISDQDMERHALPIDREGLHAASGGPDNSGSIFDAMVEYQKLINEEAREDRKIAQVEHAVDLTSNTDKLSHESGSIAGQQHEANERYDSAMQNAHVELWTGVASGAMQIGETGTALLQAELAKPSNDFQEVMSEMVKLRQIEDNTKNSTEDHKDDHSAAAANLDHAGEQYEQMLNSIGGQDSSASPGAADHGAPTPAHDSTIVGSTSEMFDEMERSIEIEFNKLEKESHNDTTELTDKIDQLTAAHEADRLAVPADERTRTPSDGHDDSSSHPHFELAAMMTDTGHHWPL